VASYSINVDWPTSIVKSATDVLNQLQSGVAGAQGSINSAVLTKMTTLIEQKENLPAAFANTLLNAVSITFSSIEYHQQHTWGIGDVNDNTVVISPVAYIGYPRNFDNAPIKVTVPNLVGKNGRDINGILGPLGLKGVFNGQWVVTPNGGGDVVSQTPAAGRAVVKGSVVTFSLDRSD
jgi:hypothetical protein